MGEEGYEEGIIPVCEDCDRGEAGVVGGGGGEGADSNGGGGHGGCEISKMDSGAEETWRWGRYI